MNKTVFIVIVIVLLLIAIGGGVLYLSITAEEPVNQEGESGFSGLFPFLKDKQQNAPDNEGVGAQDNDEKDLSDDTASNIPTPRFRQLWNEPVAGATFGVNDNGDTIIRFVDRATGNIYETQATSTHTERLTNTTLPKIQEVLWISQDQLLLRYLRDNSDIIETFAGTIVPPPDTNATNTEEIVGELSGQFLSLNILGISVQNTGSLFYLRETASGIGGFISAFNGSGVTQVFSSPIRDWLIEWVDKNTVALTTKASSEIPGHLLFLNTVTGLQTPILSSIGGLTTLAGENTVLYTAHRGNIPGFFSYNLNTGRTLPLPISTLTEKCSWSTSETNIVFCAVPQNTLGITLPDDWYQGVAHFNDTVWRVDISTLLSEQILNPQDFISAPLDIIDLTIDDTSSFLLFRNKTDGTPWLYRLTNDLQPVINNEEIESDA